MSALRPGLPPLPSRMQRLQIDERGYPVPYFVKWVDGKPEFRLADNEKWRRCLLAGRCWVCGEVVGKYKTFVIGPMCAINRTTAEPPCHLECAIFSATACPFLTLPKAQRRDANLPEDWANPGGVMITRNPGVTCLWTTLSYRTFGTDTGPLIEIGEPFGVQWYAEGVRATRTQVLASIESGLPLLYAEADKHGPGERAGVDEAYVRLAPLLPSEDARS